MGNLIPNPEIYWDVDECVKKDNLRKSIKETVTAYVNLIFKTFDATQSPECRDEAAELLKRLAYIIEKTSHEEFSVGYVFDEMTRIAKNGTDYVTDYQIAIRKAMTKVLGWDRRWE